MKKKKFLVLILLCFLIGLGITIQARLTDGERLYVSQKAVSDYKAQIQAEKKALEDVNQLIDEAKDNLSLYNKDSAAKMQNALKKDLTKNKMFAGTQTVKGKGVIVTVDDGTGEAKTESDINNLLVHDNDILRIINELKVAGAEAISINGQRVASATSVSCAGYTVRINGDTYARPFVIRAIGDSTKMTDRLIGVGGYGKELQDWGVQFQIRSANNIKIAGYEEDLDFHYMKAKKGE